MIWAQVKDEKDIDYVEKMIQNTIQQYQNNPPDSSKLEDLKKNLRYSFLMNLDTPNKVASVLARPLALTADLNSIDQFYNTLQNITPSDIQNVAKSYFVPEKSTVVILKGRQ
jgi:zinc protease